jgi:hypothetical protein
VVLKFVTKSGSVATPTVIVHDLSRISDYQTYVGITPREAVIAAYAQSLGDNNIDGYERNYSKKVKEGTISVSCGDFAARKTP